MANDFVPFLSANQTAADAAADGAATPTFVPTVAASPATDFPAGSGASVKTVPVGVAPCRNGRPGGPTILVKKEGERVTRIQIQCGCGELIELDCAY